MNQYGIQARSHWERHLPRRFQALEDPEKFFTQLGEEVSQRVEELQQAMSGEVPPTETYMERLGRLNMIRQNAESQALQELALLPEEESDEGTGDLETRTT
jgi:hypothetical protein